MKFTQVFVAAAMLVSAVHAGVVSSSLLQATPTSSGLALTRTSTPWSSALPPAGGYVVEGIYTTCVAFTFAAPAEPSASASPFFGKRAVSSIQAPVSASAAQPSVSVGAPASV
ncbi:hypothetical protein MIND_00015400 [Mycena indigotica]|uniref:Uncharacterized protein n=1 Tax=Mycena indigotica TaxID=2126181 RepID=A0A8H6TAN6_9AGAR|nr:uncharacterized protein MIND_00015400 [Mycena indigotica]KAF7315013.1 hypothetical protein MIND_00015400 [Mycena indigotica]